MFTDKENGGITPDFFITGLITLSLIVSILSPHAPRVLKEQG